MAAMTGLGNSAPEFMDGRPTGDEYRDALVRECAKECYIAFFEGAKERGIDLGGVDAGVRGDCVRIGIEPGYMYWPLKIVEIHQTKSASELITGYSWGAWGSGLRLRRKFYSQYRRQSKFVRFVDSWHARLYPTQ